MSRKNRSQNNDRWFHVTKLKLISAHDKIVSKNIRAHIKNNLRKISPLNSGFHVFSQCIQLWKDFSCHFPKKVVVSKGLGRCIERRGVWTIGIGSACKPHGQSGWGLCFQTGWGWGQKKQFVVVAGVLFSTAWGWGILLLSERGFPLFMSAKNVR